jgi:DNA polymerase III subunit gamma/tau
MLNQTRTGKKKLLTDPVLLIPYIGQDTEQRVPKVVKAQKQKIVTLAPTASNRPNKLSKPSGTNINSKLLTIESIVNPPKKKGEEQEEVDLSKMPKDPFDQARLSMVWKEFANKLRAEGKDNLASSMVTNEAVLHENYKVLLEFDNTIQMDMFSDYRPVLLDYIRTKLNNWQVSIVIKVKSAGGNKNAYLLPKDIYKQLADKNPILDQLKKTFNLEIDF